MSAEWQGDRAWQEKMRRVEALSDLTDVFTETFDAVLIPHFREQFDTEGRGRWPRLTPAYERRKRRLYGDRPILQATGAMYRAVTVPGAPHQIREAGPSEAFFGVDLARARHHQNARRRQRKIIDRTRELRRKVKAFMVKKLGERLRRV